MAAEAGGAATLVAQEERAEHEPQLKYERLGGDVGSILASDGASCLKASTKILALGTQQGVIHILDYSGNEVCGGTVCGGTVGPAHLPALVASCDHRLECQLQRSHVARRLQVKRLQTSSSAIIDLSFDRSEEYLASCSQDGVVVVSLCTRGCSSRLQHGAARTALVVPVWSGMLCAPDHTLPLSAAPGADLQPVHGQADQVRVQVAGQGTSRSSVEPCKERPQTCMLGG